MIVKAIEGFLLNWLTPLGLLWMLAEALHGVSL